MNKLLFLDAYQTYEATLTWQICEVCGLNSVALWEYGKTSFALLPCTECPYYTWTTEILATAN